MLQVRGTAWRRRPARRSSPFHFVSAAIVLRPQNLRRDCDSLATRPPGRRPHTDPVKAGSHYRLNVVLKASPAGGEFICRSAMFSSRRIKLFRPDVNEHSVTPVLGSSRYVLSIGWLVGGRTPH